MYTYTIVCTQCVSVCVHIHVYVCVHIRVCTYTCVCARTYTCVYVYIYACAYTCVYIYVCAHTCVCMCTYTCVYIHMCMCVYIHMCMCVYIHRETEKDQRQRLICYKKWLIWIWKLLFSRLCDLINCSTPGFPVLHYFTISLSLLKLMSIESMIPSNQLIHHTLLLLPSIFPSIRAFFQ